MINLQNIFLFLIITTLPSIISQKPITCNRSCPGSQLTPVPYPFGFSPGCEIQLNCTSNGLVLINEFQVQQINPEGLFVSLLATCGRHVHKLKHLYGEHYAPTSTNAILMQNCTEKMVKNCMIPATMLRTQLGIVNCSGDDLGYGNVSCYSSDVTRMFLDYESVTHMGCRFLLTGVATEMIGDTDDAISLDIQAVKLGWWLKGRCDCSSDANCTTIVSPTDGSDGYRCKCRSGFDGDGYKGSSGCNRRGNKTEISKKWTWIPMVVVAPSILFVCLGFFFCRKRQEYKRRKRDEYFLELAASESFKDVHLLETEGGKGNDHLLLFSFASIMTATNDFSVENKLGQGGFGPVYKGKLSDGREIAIKRLSRTSGQGLVEFKNELILIAKLQHTNLVRVLGCCIHREEKMLIYEYMPNKSLDFFLFDENRKAELDWPKRFNIIEGIAQGLLYLHKYSRMRVIHRDLKASNILLDENLNPKISDFGTARIFNKNETEAMTNRVVGTYGYMSPEYAMEGTFSIKSDIFSFGVLILEIVSGRKNCSFVHLDRTFNLVGYAWELLQQGDTLELKDPALGNTCVIQQFLRAVHVALLCVQESAEDRPTTSDMISMLLNDTMSLSTPNRPAFVIEKLKSKSTLEGKEKDCSVNNMTITVMGGR